MKKIVSAIVMLILSAMLTTPVLATEFVPSITNKEPGLVTTTDEEGNVVIGYIVDENGNVIDALHEHCLVVTTLSKAKSSDLIPEDAKEKLLWVYGELKNGDMEIPYNELLAGLDDNEMVVRDLIDVSWLCDDHPKIVAQEGMRVVLTFNLGISKDVDIYVMTYKNNKWNDIVEVVNNGNGTVTCTFEDFCPIGFAVPTNSNTPPAQTGDTANIALWVTLMTVSSIGLIAVLIIPKCKKLNFNEKE